MPFAFVLDRVIPHHLCAFILTILLAGFAGPAPPEKSAPPPKANAPQQSPGSPQQAGAAQQASRLPGISQIVQEDGAATAFWGIYVADVATGDVLYSRNANMSFMPASNQKILTTAAALDALGAEHRFRTTLYFDGRVSGDVLEGDLVIHGTGDPSFGSVFAPGGDPLRAWARELAAMGVRRIEGRIVGDDDRFDDRPYAEGWDIDYVTTQSSRYLGVSTNGIAYNDNVVEVKITAGSTGEAAQIETRPDGFLGIRNELTTASRRRGISVNTFRDFGSETISLRGSIPRSYAGTIVMPVTNPTAFAVQTFRAYLQDAGIEIDADAVDIDELDDFEYATDTPLFVYLSPPLREIIALVNKDSNNVYAEQLFRALAYGGSARGGERRVKELLQRAGASTEAVTVRDGSGLSRKNYITPEAMGKLLIHMHRHPQSDAFIQSLAGGGEPGSTLRHRLSGIDVRAKTGSLEFVRSLSGYALTSGGRTVVFAIFANNFASPSYRITQSIDRIVMELASAGQAS